jgi:hypothetical protein
MKKCGRSACSFKTKEKAKKERGFSNKSATTVHRNKHSKSFPGSGGAGRIPKAFGVVLDLLWLFNLKSATNV